MSTKATLAHGERFHLYEEVFDDQHVYLELEGVEFHATSAAVTVSIPLHIWEVIRQRTIADFSWADQTDEQIRATVEQEVNDRLQRIRDARSEGHKGIWALAGSLVYGSAEAPWEDQVREGIEHFTKLRERQRLIRSQIEALEKIQRGSPSSGA